MAYYGRNLICPFFGQKRGVVFFSSKIAVSVQKSWNGRDGKSGTEFSCAAQVEPKKDDTAFERTNKVAPVIARSSIHKNRGGTLTPYRTAPAPTGWSGR